MRMPAIAIVMLVASASRSSPVVNSYDTVGSRKYAHAALSVSRIRSSKYRTASLLRTLEVLLIGGPLLIRRCRGTYARHGVDGRAPRPHTPLAARGPAHRETSCRG